MPHYDFECKACGFKWDDFKSVSKMNEEESCPRCGEVDNHRIFSICNVFIKVKDGTRENDINYKIESAIGKAKDERLAHKEKYGDYSEYVDNSAPIEKRSVVDPDDVTYMGNAGKVDHQIFDNFD